MKCYPGSELATVVALAERWDVTTPPKERLQEPGATTCAGTNACTQSQVGASGPDIRGTKTVQVGEESSIM
jgi:hypothetical protein